MKSTRSHYKNYLKSSYWSEVRRMVLLRDDFTCQDCQQKRLLEIHHKTYRHAGNEKRHLSDLVTLCRACHQARHDKKKRTLKRVKK